MEKTLQHSPGSLTLLILSFHSVWGRLRKTCSLPEHLMVVEQDKACSLFAFAVQIAFVSTCRSFWDCGSVALDDISVSLGDCELMTGNTCRFIHIFQITYRAQPRAVYQGGSFFWVLFQCWKATIKCLQISVSFILPPSATVLFPLPGRCDFEAGLCGYTQDKEKDAADWERRRGPTPTSYTGPRGDHTLGLGKKPHCSSHLQL